MTVVDRNVVFVNINSFATCSSRGGSDGEASEVKCDVTGIDGDAVS